jgi:2-(1,2-epoxy-1,2-dihydrophenyl)acetyl-CoA isomerase
MTQPVTKERSTLAVTVQDGVGLIRLGRAEASGALNLQMARELFEVALELDTDPAVRAMLLTGPGPKAFCGGGDIREFVEAGDRVGAHLKDITAYFHGALSRFARSQKPLVVAVNGAAAGGGFSLAIAGDLVLASDKARFTYAYSKIGAAPDGGSTYTLTRLIGLRRAMELFYTNRTLGADEALAWGLITRVVPDAELERAALELARELAQGPTFAYGLGKRLLHAGTTETFETQMAMESEAIASAGESQDFAAAVRAFLAKQTPKFEGR